MNDRRFLFVYAVVGLLSGAELFVILTTITPSSAANEVLWTLFGCLFAFLTIAIATLWHPVKQRIYHVTGLSRWDTLRQAALLAGVITVSVFLRSLTILSLWDLIPLAISAVLIEFFFEADKRSIVHEPLR